jgi:predicted acylesterase/phospholipase RssA
MSATNTSDSKTFHVGLCMAGAVSAGAYTAGVMDYLIEALQEWQKRKDANMPDTPTHNVVIPVIGGASAGGMTAIITAASLNTQMIPVSKPSADLMAEHPENKLYHSWVDLVDNDMFPLMLNTDDINSNGIISLLNSSFIDQIANRELKANPGAAKPTPPYFDPEMKVFTTLTNLQGFAYNIFFTSNTPLEKYYMTVHNDYACFKMNNTGAKDDDGWMLLDFKNDINCDIARNAAMATGAFPVGLQSRKLSRKSCDVNSMQFCSKITKDFPVPPPVLETLNVDGGVINNEPFEKVREILIEKTGQADETEYHDFNKFKSTVVMIDPFPSSKPGPFTPDQKLFKVMGATFSAMMQQMRAKPAHLCDAMNEEKAGQFLIAPTRIRPRLDGTLTEVAGDKAIACGALDGFSGFMNKEFRIHDYFLGRFNCELFLRNYFTIPASALEQNDIFKEGYKNINKEQFKAPDGSYQIIPIFTAAPPRNYFPIPTFSSGSNWPVINEKKIDAFAPLVKKRTQALIMNAIKTNKLGKFLIWIGAKVILNKMITRSAMGAIKEALVKHQLMKR